MASHLSDTPLDAGLSIASTLDLLARVDVTSRFFADAAAVLDSHLLAGQRHERDAPPPRDGALPAPFLTVGMATYDDFDGVYFSVQAMRLTDPELMARTEILIVDNNPDGPCADALRGFVAHVPHARYVAARHVTGTAVRDLLFREARGSVVLCMDSHVLFPAGSLAAVTRHFETNPDSRDLVQGPLVCDDLETLLTHFHPVWSAGMWGQWDYDERGDGIDMPAFDIPMQGLGAFACRRDAWPGFNPRLRGFGGEEGCLHEKIRQGGARTLCLPAFRWVHRFGRPLGARYSPTWKDRIRNYLILFAELGLDDAPVVAHFVELLGDEGAQAVAATKAELANPFFYFDAIYCINLDTNTERWANAMRRFEQLGIAHRVRRFSALATPHNHQIGCALSHRAIVDEAKRLGLANVLVFEDDVVFTPTVLADLHRSLAELRQRDWTTFYLGGCSWGASYPLAVGCEHLAVPSGMTCTHAIAYHRNIYDRILDDLPATPTTMALWLRQHMAIDQYLAYTVASGHLLAHPRVASQTSILPLETLAFDA